MDPAEIQLEIEKELVENVRFYGDMRFKQLTLLSVGIGAAFSGLATDPEKIIVGSIKFALGMPLLALIFVAVLWVMEVRSTVYCFLNQNMTKRLWPVPKGRMSAFRATYAVLALHVVLYLGWMYIGWDAMNDWWRLVWVLLFIGLLVFSFANYWGDPVAK